MTSLSSESMVIIETDNVNARLITSHQTRVTTWIKSTLASSNMLTLYFCIGSSYVVSFFARSGASHIVKENPNSLSSFAYALVGGPIQVRAPLFVLAVASFCLWADSTTRINLIDVTCIYWVIIIVTVTILPFAKHSRQVVLVLNTVFLAHITVVTGLSLESDVVDYYHSNLVEITGLIYVVCGATTSAFYATNKLYITGVSFTAVGFICKLLTIYAGQYWGTCVFHVTTAYGIHVLLKLSDLDNTLLQFQLLQNRT